jgi:hypothetical protein
MWKPQAGMESVKFSGRNYNGLLASNNNNNNNNNNNTQNK